MKDPIKLPGWLPPSVRQRVEISKLEETIPESHRSFVYRLVTDRRMKDVWAWYESAISQANQKKEGHPLDPGHLFFTIEKSLRFPDKPGDWTPKRREQYFEKVRSHVYKLKELLAETKFDADWRTESMPLKTEQLEDDFRNQFNPPGSYGFEYMVCYLFNAGEMSRAPHDFPECAVMEILDRITEWTEREDFWDRNKRSTSKGILQQSSRTRIIRFTCLLYWEHLRYEISIPAAHLATITNLIFQLDNDMLDEDAVRKQIQRFMERYGEPAKMLDGWF